MHVAGEDIGEGHDSAPLAKPAWNLWFAAATASTALLGTPGANPIPPAGPVIPPVNVTSAGAFLGRLAASCVFSTVVAKMPKPARTIVLGLTSYASAARGCHSNS